MDYDQKDGHSHTERQPIEFSARTFWIQTKPINIHKKYAVQIPKNCFYSFNVCSFLDLVVEIIYEIIILQWCIEFQ